MYDNERHGPLILFFSVFHFTLGGYFMHVCPNFPITIVIILYCSQPVNWQQVLYPSLISQTLICWTWPEGPRKSPFSLCSSYCGETYHPFQCPIDNVKLFCEKKRMPISLGYCEMKGKWCIQCLMPFMEHSRSSVSSSCHPHAWESGINRVSSFLFSI